MMCAIKQSTTTATKTSTSHCRSTLLLLVLSSLRLSIIILVSVLTPARPVGAFFPARSSISTSTTSTSILTPYGNDSFLLRQQTKILPKQHPYDSVSSLPFARLSDGASISNGSSFSSSTSSSLLLLSSSSSYSYTTTLDELKTDLVRMCQSSSSNKNNNGQKSSNTIQDLVSQLESKAEQIGIGQSSALTGMMAGEW
jgi:hypothetical protein